MLSWTSDLVGNRTSDACREPDFGVPRLQAQTVLSTGMPVAWAPFHSRLAVYWTDRSLYYIIQEDIYMKIDNTLNL